MNNKLINVIIFSVGVAVGSAITWRVMKNKYEQFEYEEYEEDDCSDDDHIEDEPEQNDKPASINYNAIINNLGYADKKEAAPIDEEDDENEEDENSDIREESDNMGYGPYVIPPEEFDENDYETESLTLFADGVLVDSYNEVIDDIDDLVGLDSLDHFGEYEDDSVFVRNDDLQRDYEILRDYRTYSQAFPDR